LILWFNTIRIDINFALEMPLLIRVNRRSYNPLEKKELLPNYMLEEDCPFICLICRVKPKYKDAVYTSCDHIYCKTCWTDNMNSMPGRHKACPACNKYMPKHKTFIGRKTKYDTIMIDKDEFKNASPHECSICLNKPKYKDIKRTDCGHFFCKTCWDAWIGCSSSHGCQISCPMCRRENPRISLYKSYTLSKPKPQTVTNTTLQTTVTPQTTETKTEKTNKKTILIIEDDEESSKPVQKTNAPTPPQTEKTNKRKILIIEDDDDDDIM